MKPTIIEAHRLAFGGPSRYVYPIGYAPGRIGIGIVKIPFAPGEIRIVCGRRLILTVLDFEGGAARDVRVSAA